ncbi:unnamed protein product, partial [Musa acuminata subsp. burmannicoides]
IVISCPGEEYCHGSSRYELCIMVPLKKFNDPKSGLLVNDCCIFGAEVMEALSYRLGREGVSECLSLTNDITPQTYTWVIKNFFKLSAKQVSEVFTSWGYEWHIQLFPNVEPCPNLFVMVMVLDKLFAFPSKTRVYVDYSLCLVDQINGKHEKISGLREINFPRSVAVGYFPCIWSGKIYKIHQGDSFATKLALSKHPLLFLEKSALLRTLVSTS